MRTTSSNWQRLHRGRLADNKNLLLVWFEEKLKHYIELDGPGEAHHKKPQQAVETDTWRCFHPLAALGDWLWSGKQPLPGKSLSLSRAPFVSTANVSLSLTEGKWCALWMKVRLSAYHKTKERLIIVVQAFLSLRLLQKVLFVLVAEPLHYP